MPDPSLFLRDGDRFLPTDLARGPWGPDTLAGNVVAALLAWAVEQQESDPAFRLARLTVDLFHPTPFAPLAVDGRIVRDGRRLHLIDAALTADGVAVSRASALFLRTAAVDSPAALDAPATPPPRWDALPPRAPGFARGELAFHSAVEYRLAPADLAPGAIVWMRLRVPLLPGETTSPAVRAAALTDFVNPFAHLAADSSLGFINADVNLFLHRPPQGEWLCVAVSSRRATEGVAVADAALWDDAGPVGRCVVTSLANPGVPFAGQGIPIHSP